MNGISSKACYGGLNPRLYRFFIIRPPNIFSAFASPTRGRSPPPLHPSQHAAPPPIPRGLASTEKLSLVTISKFNSLENTVEDLKSRVYGSMPKNQEILEEVRYFTHIDRYIIFNATNNSAANPHPKFISVSNPVLGYTLQWVQSKKTHLNPFLNLPIA